jgi:hypothetical protein
MTGLRTILEGVVRTGDMQGGALSAEARKALISYRQRASWVANGVLAIVALAVLTVLVGSIYYFRSPANLKIAVGGLGLSLGPALVVLRGAWKDWGQANLMLILIQDAREDQIKRLIDSLIR